MSTRITDKDLAAVCARINAATGSPATPYADGKAQIGNFHISFAYGGVCLHRMCNVSGGVSTPLMGGHVPKRELFNAMHAYLAGLTEDRT
jgi:hypothetical protein